MILTPEKKIRNGALFYAKLGRGLAVINLMCLVLLVFSGCFVSSSTSDDGKVLPEAIAIEEGIEQVTTKYLWRIRFLQAAGFALTCSLLVACRAAIRLRPSAAKAMKVAFLAFFSLTLVEAVYGIPLIIEAQESVGTRLGEVKPPGSSERRLSAYASNAKTTSQFDWQSSANTFFFYWQIIVGTIALLEGLFFLAGIRFFSRRDVHEFYEGQLHPGEDDLLPA
ncbi:hypothetical protein [Blastopirellula retiformator]|uniref:hypothetical protein n=1 Tax=Blastopirellula retiformator TaxID=2527970 RepID=UPI0011B60BA7|nr:hypothetical protein [Blastopirellula retiformator]